MSIYVKKLNSFLDSKQFTFSYIKPHIKGKKIFEILNKITLSGFEIFFIDNICLKQDSWEKFYSNIQEKPFFQEVIKSLIDINVIIFILKIKNFKEKNAIEAFRDLIGSTNPLHAEKETIRKVFGVNTSNNAIHGSSCEEDFYKEINIVINNNA